MTSSLHQAFVELFRAEPSLVPELLERLLGFELPGHQAVAASVEEIFR